MEEILNPELKLNWEILRREKAGKKDKKIEVFDRKVIEEIKNATKGFMPGNYKISLILEYDMRKLKEAQWLKYINELFAINEGWRSFDFYIKVLPVYSPKRSYEISKEVKVRIKSDSEKIPKFLKGFFIPEAIDFADILLIRIVDQQREKTLYSAGFISSTSKLTPTVEGNYQKKLIYREAITIKEIPLVLKYYEELPGYYVVQDCKDRNVSVRCAVDQGEGFIARGEYYYTFRKRGNNLSPIEQKIIDYLEKRREIAFIKEISHNLNIEIQEAQRALVKLWKKGLLERERIDFSFDTTERLIKWGVWANNGYEFIWNSNRKNEKYPSKLCLDFDPPDWIDYLITRDVVNDFKNYLIEQGFKPRLRTTGGKIGGSHILLFLEFDRVPKNYFPFPRDKKLKNLIKERGKEGLIVAAAADFLKILALEFGMKRKKPTPITLETRDRAERLHNIYVDWTRCFPETGARSIGSIHHVLRPGGPYVCRAWEKLPESEEKMRSTSTLEYVLKNPQVLNEPEYSPKENPFSLVEEIFERANQIPKFYARNPKKFYVKLRKGI